MIIARKIYLGGAGVLAVIAALVAINVTGTNSQAMSSHRNCNDDAIIKCGAITQTELLQKYDLNVGDSRNIYDHYGISRGDIDGTSSEVMTGTVYQDGRVEVNNKIVATGAYSLSRVKFTSAGTPRTVTINDKTYYEGPSMRIFTRPVDAFVMFRNGKFYRAILSSCGNPLMATPEEDDEEPEPELEPEYSCDDLQPKKIERDRYRFTARATAQHGAEVKDFTFNFDDGTTETSPNATIEHTFEEPGTYIVKVTVNIVVDGRIKHETSYDCKTTITIDEEEEKEEPLYRCDSLAYTLISNSNYRFTLNYTADNGAMLDRVTYDFGDGTSETFDSDDAYQVEHRYSSAGSYTTAATLYFSVDEDNDTVEKSDDCEVRIVIDEEEEPCPIPGKEHLPKDSPECKEDEESPQELPKTGFETFIGGSLGLGSITAAGYYWATSRKDLLNSMLGR